jgi:hypothetical protein
MMAKILEHVIVKLLGIVDYDVLGDDITADDVLPEKFLNGCRAYVCNRLCLNPFCEILPPTTLVKV